MGKNKHGTEENGITQSHGMRRFYPPGGGWIQAMVFDYMRDDLNLELDPEASKRLGVPAFVLPDGSAVGRMPDSWKREFGEEIYRRNGIRFEVMKPYTVITPSAFDSRCRELGIESASCWVKGQPSFCFRDECGHQFVKETL